MKKFLVLLLALFIIVSIYVVKNNSSDSTSYERFNIVSPGIIRTPDERFDNLEDYVEFMDWLRAKGIRCPVLYLEEEYDTQNKKQYNVKDDPWSASKETSKKKFYPSNSKKVPVDPSAYDDMDQDIGVKNKIDSRFHSKKKYSPYAMDSNWGGPKYTQKLVNEGEFKGSTREVIG